MRATLCLAAGISAFSLGCGSAARLAPAADAGTSLSLETDRARYAPGDSVHFILSDQRAAARGNDGDISVEYFHGDSLLERHTRGTGRDGRADWWWHPPSVDGRGYMIRVRRLPDATPAPGATIAVDVSRSWSAYPRYGFLSSYLPQQPQDRERIVARLNRLHMNGIQFYDWQYKHHRPLNGSPEAPAAAWKDIANRDISLATVRDYIDAVHRRGMMAMSYNLLYGAYGDAASDGVDTNAWGLYRDSLHAVRFMFSLPPAWASNLLFMNPGNVAWQSYIFSRERDVFRALPFDGWHVDQVGDPGIVYDFAGRRVALAKMFRLFLTQAKKSLDVPLVMNAVNRFGSSEIAQAPVDFLYSEIWDSARTYSDLHEAIDADRAASGGKLASVVAAYMDYDRGEERGSFNTPGVLFTDAVIMASGGAHIELGEHMLAHEYFPNDHLTMDVELVHAIVSYYDFSVAYEEILRGIGIRPCSEVPRIRGADIVSPLAQPGKVWYFVREGKDRQVWHFVNFAGITEMEWRDRRGRQERPQTQQAIKVTFDEIRPVRSVWLASPDRNGGMPEIVQVAHGAGEITCSIPSLSYWDMMVVEYER